MEERPAYGRTITVNGKQLGKTKPKYRFKNREELDKEFEKNEFGNYIVGASSFSDGMYHLAGVPVPDEFSEKIMNSPCGIWLNLEDIVKGKNNEWRFTSEMLTLNEQENPQLEISQEKINAFKNGEWFIRMSRELENLFEEEKNTNWIGGANELVYFKHKNKWDYEDIKLIRKDLIELTVQEYKQLSEMTENMQVEDFNKEMEELRVSKDWINESKELLEKNGYAVFPLDENGIPDMSDFEGVEMEILYDDVQRDWYPAKIIMKYRGQFLDMDDNWSTDVRPIQPELTPEEIVEKLGKDYLLNLIKEKENGKRN